MRTRTTCLLILPILLTLARGEKPVDRAGVTAPEGIPRYLRDQFVTKTFVPSVGQDHVGSFDASEWREVIDKTWGQGAPTETKLQIFDTFWATIDSQFACFQDLQVDWEALRTRYRSEVEQGVSRGRFAGIMNHLAMALRDSTTSTQNTLVNLMTQLNEGTPLFYVGGWGDNGHFGAALTPLPDESLLIYRTMRHHPLGLQPGDIVLGYEGRPWKDILEDLLEAELPTVGMWWGSSESAFRHSLLMSAGLNWHLFETFDVLKYDTGEVVQLPTSPLWLAAFTSGYEQLEIPGIRMNSLQEIASGMTVSWGIVEGTSIGYIYVWGWFGTAEDDFYEAVRSLTVDQQTSGLIIDFRTTFGGNMFLSNRALELLFREEVETVNFVVRDDPLDHLSFQPAGPSSDYVIPGDPGTYYDKPIAVLTGPGAVSGGDQVALRMRFHPNVRTFGKPTSAAFSAPNTIVLGAEWTANYAIADAYLTANPGRNLTHAELLPDEEVWLTPDDVAAGRDTVVEAAIAWIRKGLRPHQLHFAHFGKGNSLLSSQLLLFNPDPSAAATATIELRDDRGRVLAIDLNGEQVQGGEDVLVPASGLRVFETDAAGSVLTGSVTVSSDRPLAGVVVFGGSTGVAGVGSSQNLSDGFLAPMQTDSVRGIDTGIAIRNLQGFPLLVDLQLLSQDGALLASGRTTLPERGHLARFINDFQWDEPVDLVDFQGVLRASAGGEIAAVVLQTQPDELATMPVAGRSSQDQIASQQLPSAVHALNFAQFGDGAGLLSSQILLLNLDEAQEATAQIHLKGDDGEGLTVDLNGQVVQGETETTIPVYGLRNLGTDGLGQIKGGSVSVDCENPLAGVILFGGPTGVAGVGSSAALPNGFLAPVEASESEEIETGIAVMNLEDQPVEVDLTLLDSDGSELATARLDLPGKGHLARFLGDLEWTPIPELSEFQGLLQATSSGVISATVLQTRPGQLATMPVAAIEEF